MTQLIVVHAELLQNLQQLISHTLDAHVKLLAKFNLEKLQNYLNTDYVTLLETVDNDVDLLDIYVKAHELNLPCVINQNDKKYQIVMIGPCSETNIVHITETLRPMKN